MADFTFHAYRRYLEAIQNRYDPILRFDEYFRMKKKTASFALIRHDVDRRPLKALRMARLEAQMGIRSTYYFRAKSTVFDPAIIRAVRRSGHEIGYHYEDLSDADGDYVSASVRFGQHLAKFRRHARIDTISMHGRPFSLHDNRDLWRPRQMHSRLKSEYGILGEVYLDIDYSDIAYISDTGRNWEPMRANRRDRVASKIQVDVKNGRELLMALKKKRWRKIVFQIHPERWAESGAENFAQFVKDTGINLIKRIL